MQTFQLLLLASVAVSSVVAQPNAPKDLAARQDEEPDYSGNDCDMSDPNCNNDNGHGNDEDCSCSDPSCSSFACIPDDSQFGGLTDDPTALPDFPEAEPTTIDDPAEPTDFPSDPTDDPLAAMTTDAAFPSETSEAPSKATKTASKTSASITTKTSSSSSTSTGTAKPTPVVHHGAAPKAVAQAPLALAAIGVFALAL